MSETLSPKGQLDGTDWPADDALCHRVCCEDENLSLCKADVSGASWRVTPGGGNDCIVCDDLDNQLICPLFDRCRVDR
jgi:hypothetical protein